MAPSSSARRGISNDYNQVQIQSLDQKLWPPKVSGLTTKTLSCPRGIHVVKRAHMWLLMGLMTQHPHGNLTHQGPRPIGPRLLHTQHHMPYILSMPGMSTSAYSVLAHFDTTTSQNS